MELNFQRHFRLMRVLFQESDEFTVRVAETVDEAVKLLEATVQKAK